MDTLGRGQDRVGVKLYVSIDGYSTTEQDFIDLRTVDHKIVGKILMSSHGGTVLITSEQWRMLAFPNLTACRKKW